MAKHLGIIALMGGALALGLQAKGQDLEYYLPFDDGTSASLTNYGTLGGTATVATVNGGTPTASTFVDSALGTGYSESFGGVGGVVLPASTGQFGLSSSDTTTDSMTLSTWIYMPTTTYSGIANKSTDSATPGWTEFVTPTGQIDYQWTNAGGVASVATTTTLAVGEWVNVTLVSGPNVADVQIYFNGVAQVTGNPFAGTGQLSDSSTLPIQVGAAATTYGSNTGYLDDYAMWNGVLIPGEITSLYTAPQLIAGYNAGVMNQLFTAYGQQGSAQINGLTWAYDSGFDTTGHSLGDSWTANGTDYIWLSGSAGSAVGLDAVLSAPEPSTWAMLCAGGVFLIGLRRFRREA